MSVFLVVIILLVITTVLFVSFRCERIRNELKMETLLAKCFVFGILIGAIVAFLSTEDIWSVVKLK